MSKETNQNGRKLKELMQVFPALAERATGRPGCASVAVEGDKTGGNHNLDNVT